MKKLYIAPSLVIEHIELQQFICNSITSTSGDANISIEGDEVNDETPAQGDSRRKNVWDDDEEEDYNGKW